MHSGRLEDESCFEELASVAGWLEDESCVAALSASERLEDFSASIAVFAATVGSESAAVGSWSSSSSSCPPQSHFHIPEGWKVEVLMLFGLSLKNSGYLFLDQIVHQVSLCYCFLWFLRYLF